MRALIEEASRDKNIQRRAFTVEQIQPRALGATVNEVMVVLQDGIAERGSDVDLVLVNGYGFPADRGGPLFWASRLPPDEVERMVDDVARDIGFGFRRADFTTFAGG